jgi:hypothetical protein
VLKRATPTQSEVRAARLDAIRGGLQHFDQHAIIVLLVTFRASEADAFARECASDERSLAFADDALAFVRDGDDDAGFFNGRKRRS